MLRALKKIKTSTEDGSEQRLHGSDLTLLRESPKSIIIFFLVYVYMPVRVCSYVCRYTCSEVCVYKCMKDMDILRYSHVFSCIMYPHDTSLRLHLPSI